jgi:hypothetical protein
MGLVAVWQVDPSGQCPSLCLYAAACNRWNHELVYSCNGLNQASGFLARPSTPICVLAGSCSHRRRLAAAKGRNSWYQIQCSLARFRVTSAEIRRFASKTGLVGEIDLCAARNRP